MFDVVEPGAAALDIGVASNGNERHDMLVKLDAHASPPSAPAGIGSALPTARAGVGARLGARDGSACARGLLTDGEGNISKAYESAEVWANALRTVERLWLSSPACEVAIATAWIIQFCRGEVVSAILDSSAIELAPMEVVQRQARLFRKWEVPNQVSFGVAINLVEDDRSNSRARFGIVRGLIGESSLRCWTGLLRAKRVGGHTVIGRPERGRRVGSRRVSRWVLAVRGKRKEDSPCGRLLENQARRRHQARGYETEKACPRICVSRHRGA